MNSQCYNLIIYDYTKLYNFVNALVSNKGKNVASVKYAYILHDSDMLDAETYKKAHYHLWLLFPTQVKSAVIETALDFVGLDASALSHQKTDSHFLAYLTHDTSDSKLLKCHYKREDIGTNMEEDEFNELYYEALSYWDRKAKSNSGARYVEYWDIITGLMELHQPANYRELLESVKEVATATNNNGLFKFTIDKKYTLQDLFKTEFNINMINRFASTLEGSNIERLAIAQQRYEEALKNKKGLDKIDYDLDDMEVSQNEK